MLTRDEEIIDLLKDVMCQHVDEAAIGYHNCEEGPCDWCVRAEKLLQQMTTNLDAEKPKCSQG